MGSKYRNQKRRWNDMVNCGICGGEAPKQPCITEEGKCDICGKKVTLTDEKKIQDKKI